MSEVPYYLSNSVQAPTFGQIDLYDFSTPPQTTVVTDSSIWSNLADQATGLEDYVWNATTGVWDDVKSGAKGLVDDVTGELKEGYSFLQGQVFLWVGVALIVVVVVAKTGILKQAAGVMKP